ncbi:MAG: hypothetical protein DRR06_04755 [Gammaproteobacteria bacterium]|nr:MAG: hypothetical protein DRR42_24975 [Gammaproteobacteria bacterium]RLA46541.1 MAG: hypothetical protein DRR06_04755 [Gammaproteobacteria bacterium]
MNASIKLTVLAATAALLLGPLSASADKKDKNDHDSGYEIAELGCECGSWEFVDSDDDDSEPDHWQGSCYVSWVSTAPAPTYGADIEFEAEWLADDGITEVEISNDNEIEEYACEGDEASETCTAEAVPVALGDFPAGAETEFEVRVKGFANGKSGKKPRDFTKAKADCEVLPDPDSLVL